MKKLLALTLVNLLAFSVVASATNGDEILVISAKDQVVIEMTTEDTALIASYKEDWAKAKESGDKAAMTIAHNNAQAIRAKYNFSGGETGGSYDVLYTLAPKNYYNSTLPVTLIFDFTNNASTPLNFGAEYALEVLENDVWTPVSFKEEIAFIQSINTLPAGESDVLELPLTQFDTLNAGTYRLVKEATDDLGNNHKLYGEFLLTEDVVTIGSVLKFEENQAHILTGDTVQVFDVASTEGFEAGQMVIVLNSENSHKLLAYNH